MGIWHYTTFECLLEIITDGQIRPATERVPVGERPIVWFSRNPKWEPTATKTFCGPDGTMREATIEEMEQIAGGLARIEVQSETAPHGWRQLQRLSCMRASVARRLEKAALRVYSFPEDWRGTFDPVPKERWISIEVFRNGTWVPLENTMGGGRKGKG